MDDEVPEEDMENDVEANDPNMQTESKIIKCTKKQIFENFGILLLTKIDISWVSFEWFLITTINSKNNNNKC